MWKKLPAIIIIFYVLALLQNSFFVHFPLFSANLNLTFILFFIFVYLGRDRKYIETTVMALIAGLFIDLFSYSYIGPNILSFLLVGLSLEYLKILLKEGDKCRPFVYFVPLFSIFFILFRLSESLVIYFIDYRSVGVNIGLSNVVSLFYNLIIASIIFCAYKKINEILLGKKFNIGH